MAVEITSREELRDWVGKQPIDLAHLVTFRTALRVWPIIGREYKIQNLLTIKLNNLFSSIPRVYFMSLNIFKYTGRGLKLFAPYAPDFAVLTALAKYADASTHKVIWSAVSADANWLIENQGNVGPLIDMPLWLDGEPQWAAEERKAFFALPIENLDVWRDWYERVLEGRGPFGFGAQKDEELAVKIATQDDAFWEREFGVVSGEIKGWIEEMRPPGNGKIPSGKPATVRPIWKNGVLFQSDKPVDHSLEERILDEFAEGLKAELQSLANSFGEGENIDKRVLAYFVETANLIPTGSPNSERLFHLVIRESLLQDLIVTVEKEWPEFSAKRYYSLCKQFSNYLDRFADKRKFDRDELEGFLEAVNLDLVQRDAEEFIEFVSSPAASEVIDSSIPTALASIGSEIEVVEEGRNLPVEVSDKTKIKKAADQLESINNTFKKLLGGDDNNQQLDKLKKLSQDAYRRGFIENLESASYEAGKEDVKKFAKIANRGALGATAIDSALNRLKLRYPKVFNWWDSWRDGGN